MPGISQRVMRIRERATGWRPTGRVALALIAPAVGVAALAVPATMASAAVPGPPSGWSTVFSDDFNGGAGAGIDSHWMYDTGAGSSLGTAGSGTMTDSTDDADHVRQRGRARGRRARSHSLDRAAVRRPRLLAGVLDARTWPVARERRDRH